MTGLDNQPFQKFLKGIWVSTYLKDKPSFYSFRSIVPYFESPSIKGAKPLLSSHFKIELKIQGVS